MGHGLWIHNLELPSRYFDDIGSDEDPGGSHHHRRLIQLFRHQIQLLTARPAPAEPHHHVAKLECLGAVVN